MVAAEVGERESVLLALLSILINELALVGDYSVEQKTDNE